MNSLITALEKALQRENIREMLTDKQNKKKEIRSHIIALKKAIALFGDRENRGFETADR